MFSSVGYKTGVFDHKPTAQEIIFMDDYRPSNLIFIFTFEIVCQILTVFFFFLQLLQYLSPQPDTNDSISSGFDEDPPS